VGCLYVRHLSAAKMTKYHMFDYTPYLF